MTELVAAVVRRIGLHAVDERVAAEDLGKVRRRDIRLIEAEQRGHLRRVGDEPRRRHRGGFHARVKRSMHLARMRPHDGVAGQPVYESVVEAKWTHRDPKDKEDPVRGLPQAADQPKFFAANSQLQRWLRKVSTNFGRALR